MSRSARLTILAFAGLMLLLVVASAALGWHIGLSVTAVAGAFVIWAALRSTGSANTQSQDSVEILGQVSMPSEEAQSPLTLTAAEPETCFPRRLLDTTSDLFRRLDPNDVVSAALEHAIRLADADSGSVLLLGEEASGEMRIAGTQGLSPEATKSAAVLLGEQTGSWVLINRRPLVIEDFTYPGPERQRHDLLAAASVPIADDEGALGILNVGSNRYPSQISRSAVADLEAVGRVTASALRNARAVESSNDLFLATIEALALALESGDPYARGGTARVVALSVLLEMRSALTKPMRTR